jgi:hypothetical protein
VQLFVPDWRRRCADPGGEELEKPAQALVVELRRGLDHAGRGLLVTGFQDASQRLCEVVWEMAHRWEFRSRN